MVVGNPEVYAQWLENQHQVPTIKLEEQDQETVSKKDTQKIKNRKSAQKSRDSQKKKLTRLGAFENHLNQQIQSNQQIRDRVRIEEEEDAQLSEQAHNEGVLPSSVFQRSPLHNRTELEECFLPFVCPFFGNQ